jgi:hypothetical protein
MESEFPYTYSFEIELIGEFDWGNDIKYNARQVKVYIDIFLTMSINCIIMRI